MTIAYPPWSATFSFKQWVESFAVVVLNVSISMHVSWTYAFVHAAVLSPSFYLRLCTCFLECLWKSVEVLASMSCSDLCSDSSHPSLNLLRNAPTTAGKRCNLSVHQTVACRSRPRIHHWPILLLPHSFRGQSYSFLARSVADVWFV